MPNPFVFVEHYSNDLDASKKFYTSLLGWKLNEVAVASVPDGKYTMIEVGEGSGGGM